MNLPPEQVSIRAKCIHPSGTFAEFPKEDVEASIPARFEKIARAHPDHLAIKTPVGELTYGELNSAANRVAHMLLDRERSGAQPVALLFDSGAQLIVAMLGVLKAGHFFVLVDPSLPKDKIVEVLAKSQASLVLSDARNLRMAKQAAGSVVNAVDYDSVSRWANSADCELPLSPQTFGYVVYTSGSTGEPKGVIWTHQTLLHHVRVITNTYRICKEDRISLMASMSGGALATIAHALLNGATLYPYDVQRSGVRELGNWLRCEQITIWFMPSPLFRSMAASEKAQNPFSHVRLLRLRSDKVHQSDLELCKKILPSNCVIVTGLATTETGTIRMSLLDRETEICGNEVPIGFPVEDKEIFLMDDDGKPVGFNEVGEIVVRSKYLSPGYWNNPELTQTKFKRDPEDPSMRLYYTGDLGLMRSNGCLIHNGRKDWRVKVRGYAVDLIEVETALRTHSGIREAVISTEKLPSADARLIAYFTSAQELAPTVTELRAHLQEKLATYMVPSVFVQLEKLPLTRNGKVDRNGLPKPDHRRPELDTPYLLPKNPIDKVLAQIWEEVLAVRPIGIYDNFFDLGGHSLAMTRVVSRVFQHFQLEIPLPSLFQTPTIADMRALITSCQGNNSDDRRLTTLLEELESLSDEEASRQVGGAKPQDLT